MKVCPAGWWECQGLVSGNVRGGGAVCWVGQGRLLSTASYNPGYSIPTLMMSGWTRDGVRFGWGASQFGCERDHKLAETCRSHFLPRRHESPSDNPRPPFSPPTSLPISSQDSCSSHFLLKSCPLSPCGPLSRAPLFLHLITFISLVPRYQDIVLASD